MYQTQWQHQKQAQMIQTATALLPQSLLLVGLLYAPRLVACQMIYSAGKGRGGMHALYSEFCTYHCLNDYSSSR